MTTQTRSYTEDSLDDLPTLPDGSPYPYALVGGGSIVLAETITEVVTLIADEEGQLGYEDADPTRQLEIRHELAVVLASEVQTSVLAELADADLFDPAELSEEDLTILAGSKDEPHGTDGKWEHDIPLVLVGTMYAPYTEVEAPVGDEVRIIDPATEDSFARDLDALSIIQLHLADTAGE